MRQPLLLTGGIASGALFSDCKRYRYRLWRTWDTRRPRLAFCMLNPSTADETTNDPTVERCQRRAQQLGYGGLIVVNAFALRSTDPKGLRKVEDPVGGPENDDAIRWAAEQATLVVAWGSHGGYLGRDRAVADLLLAMGCSPLCLGTTKAGQPRHPLYVSYAVRLERWNYSSAQGPHHTVGPSA